MEVDSSRLYNYIPGFWFIIQFDFRMTVYVDNPSFSRRTFAWRGSTCHALAFAGSLSALSVREWREERTDERGGEVRNLRIGRRDFPPAARLDRPSLPKRRLTAEEEDYKCEKFYHRSRGTCVPSSLQCIALNELSRRADPTSRDGNIASRVSSAYACCTRRS